VNEVAALVDEATRKMEPLYQDLVENMLIYIESVHQQHDTAELQSVKYWSVMLGLAYDILDKVQIFLFVGFEAFTVAAMKNAIFWDLAPCRSCVRTDVLEDHLSPSSG
jgi:hypothetical protein